MVHIRGQRQDFDDWEAMGNHGWGYADVLPYFRKSENMTNAAMAATPYRGTDGYLTVGEPPFRTKMVQAFIAAGQELGYQETDLNGADGIGIMMAQGTIRNGRRCSTAKAFLRSAHNRTNLHLSVNSHVTKILIHPYTKHAYGVEFQRNGRLHQVHVSKKVIVSGGTINSPQILMLSGIGPASELENFNIPVVSDLPVGKNLRDHFGVSGLEFSADIPSEPIGIYSSDSIEQYSVNGTGPLTMLNGFEVIALVQTKFANASDDRPDVELMFGSCYANLGNIKNSYGEFNNETFLDINRKCWKVQAFSLLPQSSGVLFLRSANPFEHPIIHANYLENNNDLNIMREGLKIVVSLGKTKVMEALNSSFAIGNFEVCNHFVAFSDDFYECIIRQYTYPVNHQVGTCKMGPDTDIGSVVDSELRVRGVNGVRIIDASIMPNVIGGHTNAATIMIGEKGSDMIKSYWQYPL